MLRQTLIIALAALGCLSVAQEQSTKFSFKAPAAPAKRVFEELSKAAGTPLVAGGAVGDDVILLNLTDVTLADAMDKIAATLHAEWRKEGSGWVLYRGPNFEGADRRSETAIRVAEFRTNLNRILDEQKKAGAFTSDTAKKMVDMQNKMNEEAGRQTGNGPIRLSSNFGSVSQLGPAARAIASLLSRMSDAQIANLTSGGRTVFSLNPTRMQLAMPNGANQLLQQFIKDCQTYKDISTRNEPPQTGESRRIILNGFGADGLGDGNPALGIGYAILVNQPSLGGANVSLSLIVADPNGKTIASGQFFVGGAFVQNAPTPQAQTPATEEKPIELSPLSKELANVLNQISGGSSGRAGIRVFSVATNGGGGGSFTVAGGGESKTPAMSPELKERVLSPDKYDPMSFAPGEALTLSADAKGKDLVAYLPDTSFLPLNQIAANGALTPSTFLKAAQAQLEIKEEGGWILASPKTPAAARDRKVNRSALGVALRLMQSKGFLSLDDWAAFAGKQVKAPRFGEFDDSYFRLINGPAADAGLSQFTFGSGWQMLQFYGSMSNAQRLAMTQSGRVPLNTLSQYQLSLVSDQVFNSFDGPNVMNRSQPNGPVTIAFGGQQGVQSERTFLLPNGIPRDGFLNFNYRQQEIVQANSTTSGGGRFMTPDALAFERMRGERPELANFGPSTQYDEFRMASQRTVGFHFQFTPDVSLNRQLEDNSPGNQPYGPYDRLPGDFKKKVEQLTEQLKKSWGGVGTGGPGQVPPPR